MSSLDTAEYRRLALIAAGVPPQGIPSILDTATWRRMLIAALLKNSASQVISGSVDRFSDLPTTMGSPAVGATYLVRYSSGIYYINYRSAGVYMKVTDTGSSSDWVYIPMSAIGTLPDVTLTDLQSGDALVWDGSKWVNQIPAGANAAAAALNDSVSLFEESNPTSVSGLAFALDANSTYRVDLFISVGAADGVVSVYFDASGGMPPITKISGTLPTTARELGYAGEYFMNGLIFTGDSNVSVEVLAQINSEFSSAQGFISESSFLFYQKVI
jgi:hypothetical protein